MQNRQHIKSCTAFGRPVQLHIISSCCPKRAVFAEGGCHIHMSSGPASGRQPAEVLTKCPWSSRSEIFALSRRWLRTSGSKVEPRPVTRSNSRIIEAERGIMINRASRPCRHFWGHPAVARLYSSLPGWGATALRPAPLAKT